VPDRIVRGALGVALLVALGACSEQVASSVGCPELCSDQSATLRDTVLSGAIVLDTTLMGFPLPGTSHELSLVSRGDTADVRVVARFDTLPQTYRPLTPQPDSLIKLVDSATMIFLIDTSFVKPKFPVTIDAYDVDTTADDQNRAALVPLFRPDRLIGSTTYQPGDLKDTLRLTLDNAAIFQKATANVRLRIGLRLRADQSATLRLSATTFAPRIRFRVAADTAVAPDTVYLTSKTPANDIATATIFAFYPVVAAGALPAPPLDRLAVGGLSGARTYLRFEIPPIVLDSVQVIRASLQLTQPPSRSVGGNRDTLTLFTQAVLASPEVTDVFTASQFLSPLGVFFVDTLRLIPGDSLPRSVELVNLVRAWRIVGTEHTSRAIVLSVQQEGSSPGEVNFYSSGGPVDLRPRLRLTYVPRRGFGLP
jgi:hypothetical protein